MAKENISSYFAWLVTHPINKQSIPDGVAPAAPHLLTEPVNQEMAKIAAESAGELATVLRSAHISEHVVIREAFSAFTAHLIALRDEYYELD